MRFHIPSLAHPLPPFSSHRFPIRGLSSLPFLIKKSHSLLNWAVKKRQLCALQHLISLPSSSAPLMQNSTPYFPSAFHEKRGQASIPPIPIPPFIPQSREQSATSSTPKNSLPSPPLSSAAHSPLREQAAHAQTCPRTVLAGWNARNSNRENAYEGLGELLTTPKQERVQEWGECTSGKPAAMLAT